MYIISSFDHSVYLELALTKLQQLGIKKEKILAMPLNLFMEEERIFDSIHHSDGVSLFDIGPALAVAITVVSSSYGFVLPGGPIIWGIIGAATGLILGFTLDLLISKRRRKIKRKNKKPIEVFILIRCDENQVEFIKKVLKNHFAQSFATIDGTI